MASMHIIFNESKIKDCSQNFGIKIDKNEHLFRTMQGVSKKLTVGKYSLNLRACKVGKNFQLAQQVLHPLVHLALKLFKILPFLSRKTKRLFENGLRTNKSR